MPHFSQQCDCSMFGGNVHEVHRRIDWGRHLTLKADNVRCATWGGGPLSQDSRSDLKLSEPDFSEFDLPVKDQWPVANSIRFKSSGSDIPIVGSAPLWATSPPLLRAASPHLVSGSLSLEQEGSENKSGSKDLLQQECLSDTSHTLLKLEDVIDLVPESTQGSQGGGLGILGLYTIKINETNLELEVH